LRLGHGALATADWERARDLFEQAVELGETAEILVAANPNLRLVRLPGAGHNAWIDDPETVVTEIEHFLERPRRPRARWAA
jgi:pimeloyl-ACP methyl ester carboxylesterase